LLEANRGSVNWPSIRAIDCTLLRIPNVTNRTRRDCCGLKLTR
jgi:hypothetical protein